MRYATIARPRRIFHSTNSQRALIHSARRSLSAFIVVVLASCGGGGDSPTKQPTVPETPQVATVNINPGTGQLIRTQTLQFTATPVTSSGATVSGKTVQWSASPSTVASVSTDGLVTGIATGTATITAASDGKTATATVRVVDGSMIGASGGTVATTDGKITVEFPAGALNESVPVTIVPNTTTPTTAKNLPGTVYDISPSRTFAQPVVLTMKYTPPANAAEALIGLYSYESGNWVAAPNSVVDTIAHTVTAPVTHFSTWTSCVFSCGALSAGSSVSFSNVGFNLLQGNSHIIVGVYGTANYGGALTCQLYDAPAGLTASISLGATDPNRGGAGLITATIRAAANTAPGLYHMSIGCGGSGVKEDPGTLNVLVQANGFSYTLASTNLSVTQGASTATDISITRVGTPGAVAFSTVNFPTGVTASFNPASVSGASTVMTITAATDAPVGTYSTPQVAGTAGTLGPITNPVVITVVSNSGFSLVGTPAFASVAVGGIGSTGVKAVRVPGFTSLIAYTFTGLPAGLTANFTATSVTDSISIVFAASAVMQQGTYVVNLVGTANGKTQTVPISVTVGAAGTTIVQIDLSQCLAAGRTIWVAGQDGTAPFQRITGSSGVYTFPITTARGATAIAINGSDTEVFVNYGTPAELMARDFCRISPPDPHTRTLNVSAIGMANVNEFVDITTGGYHTTLQFALSSETLPFLPDGLLDIVAWKYSKTVAGQGVRGIIRRAQSIANGGTAAPFDFTTNVEAFDPATAPVSSGGFGGESGGAGMSYYIGARCRAQYDLGNTAPFTSTLYGLPASAMKPGELHAVYMSTNTRYAANYFSAMTSQSIALGAAAPSLSLTTLPGSYQRRQVALTLPADYAYAFYEYSDGAGHWASVSGNAGYFGGAAMTLPMPDLSAVDGFNAAWVPANSTTGRWNFTAATHPSRPCTDGSRYREARLTGVN